MHLTPRQLDIVRFILDYRAQWSFSPTLQEIADHLGVSAVTVYEHTRALERKRALRRTPHEARSLEIIDPELQALAAPSPHVILPLLGEIAAGQPLEALETAENVNLGEMLALDRAAFMLRVRGDSMVDDHIADGDFVLVERRETAQDGETVVALLPDGEVTLKKFYRERDRIRLQPANPEMEPIYTKDVQIQGVVVGIIRKCAVTARERSAPPREETRKPERRPADRVSELRAHWRQALQRARRDYPTTTKDK